MKYYLAIDIGASSGRHILGWVDNGKMMLEEIYRFNNDIEEKNGHLCWNYDRLFESIVAGIKECGRLGKIPYTIGIDTWAVDFVLLDKNNRPIGDTVAYRDSRTNGMDKILEQHISEKELYSRTGIQKQMFNSVYQLLAIKQSNPEQLDEAESFLMVPEYFNFLLTGVKKNEYTNATTTALVNASTKRWDNFVTDALGLPKKLFSSELYMPCEIVGELTEQIQKEVGFNSRVILPATHDTGSAFLAVPARDENAVYISSGTWSLLGVEILQPITTEQSRQANFTNEGGYTYRYRYLKNIMGLWMIQSVRRELDKKYSFAELEEMARKSEYFSSVVNVNDAVFLAPKSMINAVKDYCAATRQKAPETIGEIMQCIYISLASSYKDSISELERLTSKSFTSINIVGGGSKDGYLNSLTAKATGLPVFAGPTEGTALGNLIAQFIAAGEYKNLEAARAAIKNSFEIKQYR